MKPLYKAVTWMSFIYILLLGGLLYYTQTQVTLLAQSQQQQNSLLMERISAVQEAGEQKTAALQEKVASGLQELGISIEKTREETKKSVRALTGQLQIVEELSEQKIGKLEEQLLNVNVKSGDFTGIIDKAIKAVVSITTDIGIGSGAIIDKDGYIITNRHVIENARKGSVKTSDGRVHAVRIVAKSPHADLAVLKIEGEFSRLLFTKKPLVGSRIIAMGSPAGLEFTVTEGIVSAVRTIGNIEYVQTDLSLNPGNSGGPVVNTKGEIVGIVSQKVKGFEGLGFAIAPEEAKQFVAETIEADEINP